jgi:hypothetical protein
MIAERRVLPLERGLMTTLTVRARKQAIKRRFTTLAVGGAREVRETACALAGDQIAERIGERLSTKQSRPMRSR